ncbi:MAG: hypothetical protein ACYTG0_43555 [Planctomycetota bacterium]|jgi:hypothetical protein
MSDLPRAAASGVPVNFKGETVLVAPLTIRDLGTIKQHLLKGWVNPIGLVLPVVKDLPESLAREMLTRAYDDARNPEKVSDADVDQFMSSIEGVAYQLWLSLRHNYQDKYSLEDVWDGLDGMSPEDLEAMRAAASQASGMDDLGNSTGRAGQETTPDAEPLGVGSSAS